MEGMGAGLLLPAFVADFIQGVSDRLCTIVKDVQVDLSLRPSGSSSGNATSFAASPDEVTVRLNLSTVRVNEVTENASQLEAARVSEGALAQIKDSVGSRNRQIMLTGLQISLLSTSALSSFMSQLSSPSPPSPTMAHTNAMSRRAGNPNETRLSQETSSGSSGLGALDSSIRDVRHDRRQDLRPSSTVSSSHTPSESEGNSQVIETSAKLFQDQAENDWMGSRFKDFDDTRDSFLDEIENRTPVGFNEDSQVLSASDAFNFGPRPQHTTLSPAVRGATSFSDNRSASFTSPIALDPESIEQPSSRVDNARSAQFFYGGRDLPETSLPVSSPKSSLPENLTESRVFTHQEAESMYLSAMSQGRLKSSKTKVIPGGWASDESDLPESPEATTDVFHDVNPPIERVPSEPSEPLIARPVAITSASDPKIQGTSDPDEDDSPPRSLYVSEYAEDPRQEAPTPTQPEQIDSPKPFARSVVIPVEGPRPQTVEPPRASTAITATVKPFFFVDQIDIRIPQPKSEVSASAHFEERPSDRTELPGSFSAHQSEYTSPPTIVPSEVRNSRSYPQEAEVDKKAKAVSVHIENVIFLTDIAFIRLIIIMSQHTSTLGDLEPRKNTNADVSQQEAPKYPGLLLNLDRLSMKFVDVLKNHSISFSQTAAETYKALLPSTAETLLQLEVESLVLSRRQEIDAVMTEILVGKLVLGFSDEDLLSFDSTLKMRESVRDVLTPIDQDLSLKLKQLRKSATELEIMSAPVHIMLNLARLEDAINWLGGLSSVLDLGSSVMSTVTVTEPKASSLPLKPRGVHFEGYPSKSISDPTEARSSTKVYVRLGGIAVDLHGKLSSVSLEGSAVKVVARADAARMQVDRLRFYGPILKESTSSPATAVQVETFKLEYVSVPKENDLGRLLALLSPSQDRDTPDDDILLDTLLRQRRKGSLLRVNVSKLSGDVSRIHELQYFQGIADELSQLSTVAKYLPEDDRPGLLILALVESLNLSFEPNSRIGPANLILKNPELALVTLPSLFLLGVDLLQLKHRDIELVGEASPRIRRGLNTTSAREDHPAIMVKFIGDEMEPTLKVKLSNLRVEYHVSTIMAAMGVSETASGEVIVAEMVNSVANLKAYPTSPKSSASSTSISAGKKPFKIDVNIRDCTVGLNPKGASAKGLVVLSKSRVSVTLPSSDHTELDSALELTKASLMLVDDTRNLVQGEDVTDANILADIGTKPSQLQSLSAIGYARIGDISSARIDAKTTKSEDAETHLDVEIHDDLFVLETCADSTQTLEVVLGGLAPPTPPSKGLKYRTEIVPIENMLASFSGDAFSADPRMEDDTDYSADDDDDRGTLALDDDNEDELPPDFGLEGSFYDNEIRSVTQSAGSSMLGADLSALGGPPAESVMSEKPVLESFQEQVEASEPLHFDENYFGKKTNIGGRAHRWNSEKNTYDMSTDFRIRGSPLRLRLRDAHFIWNLFDGYDWQRTRETISQAVNEIEFKAAEKTAARREKRKTLEEEDDEESVIGDFLFNSIYIGIPANQDPRDLSRRINGDLNDAGSETGSYTTMTTVAATPSRQGSTTSRKRRLRLQRSKHHKMTFELKGVSADVIVFPPDTGETQSSIDIRVDNLDIFDHVPTSTWKKFATYMHDAGERESGSSMVHIEMLTVKPDADLLASEIVLKASILPLRLHVDQDALDFMTRFFEFKDTSSSTPAESGSSKSTPAPTIDSQPFLQRAEVGPIRVKLDFKPKRVDYAGLRSGHTTEFMHFFVLDGADMVLRRTILYGVRGFEKLGRSLNDIWMPDVKRNQLPGVLAGLAPVRSLVNVGAGVRDLVVVPMREYKKDGRLVRAVQKGAVAFAKSTSTELTKLGAKLAVGTHNILQGAEGLLASPDPSNPISSRPLSRHGASPSIDDPLSESPPEEKPVISPYADQPIGVVQGLRGAYRHLERDLLLAKDAIVAMPGEVMEARTAGGAAKAVWRGAPTVVLRPAMGVSKAVAQTMMGATNALDRGERRRVEEVNFPSISCSLNIGC